MLAFLSRGDGWLLGELLGLDHNAKQLIDDKLCQWVRSRPGIIGIVQLANFTSIEQLSNILRRLIEHAYNLLDGLPQATLSVQDIWNVTLLIAVPVMESELDPDSAIGRALRSTSRDVTGSKKLSCGLIDACVTTLVRSAKDVTCGNYRAAIRFARHWSVLLLIQRSGKHLKSSLGGACRKRILTNCYECWSGTHDYHP